MKENMISMNRISILFLTVLNKLGKPIFFACTFTLLAGCAAEPAKTIFYETPDLEPTALVSINGARTTSGYTNDKTTYLAAVDGLPIENAKEYFAFEIKVAPGYRALTVACAQDSLLATSEITTELKAGHSYLLKAEKTSFNDAVTKSTQGDGLYNIWIEESLTQEVAGVKHLAKLNAIANNISNPANDVTNPAITSAAGDFLIKLVGVVLDAMIESALAPDNTRTASNAGAYSNQPTGGVTSTPTKQAPSPAIKTPGYGKTVPSGDAQPGRMKN